MKRVTFALLIATFGSFFSSPIHASDADGRCLKIAEVHCAAILTTFGPGKYGECVSRRQNQCLRTGR